MLPICVLSIFFTIQAPSVNPTPPVNPIRLPATAVPTAPAPATPQTLKKDIIFYIDSDVPVEVFPSPAGLVKLTKESGPLRVQGYFIDDPKTLKKKTYQGKYLYQIEAVKSGACEILILPAKIEIQKDTTWLTLDDEKKVIRRSIVVDVPLTPTPVPPTPNPVDPVTPVDPPQPVVVTSFRVIFVYETGSPMTAAQNGAMLGIAVQDYLVANTTPEGGLAGFRRFDKDTSTTSNDQATMLALWAAVKPKLTTVPCMVVEVNGQAKILPFPANQTDCLATLKKYHGDK